MMEIGPLHQPHVIVEGHLTQPAPAPEPEKKTAPRGDSVEISDNARERLALAADAARTADEPAAAAAGDTDGDLRQDRIRLARARIRSGYYNQPEIKQDVAARLADNINETPPENPEGPA